MGTDSIQRPCRKNVARVARRSQHLEQLLGATRVRAVGVLRIEGQRDADRSHRRAAYFSTPVMTMPRVKKREVSRNATTGMIIVISVPAWISSGLR